MRLVGCGWWWLVGVVPPPLGAFARRARIGPDFRWGCGGWAGQRPAVKFSTQAVGDRNTVSGTADGDHPPVMQPVVERADQDQIVQFGFAAVLPVPDVVAVQTAGGPTPRDRTRRMPILQRPAQLAVDHPGGTPTPDRLAVAFEPHLTGRITGQIPAVGIGEHRADMQGGDAVFDIQMHHHRGLMPVRAAGGIGIPARIDEGKEGVQGGRERGPAQLLLIGAITRPAVTVGVFGDVLVAFPLRDQRIPV